MTADAPPLAFAITTGGTPTPPELAAITIALTPVAAPPPPDDKGRAGDRHPAWHRAALLEGTGHARFTNAPDLAASR